MLIKGVKEISQNTIFRVGEISAKTLLKIVVKTQYAQSPNIVLHEILLAPLMLILVLLLLEAAGLLVPPQHLPVLRVHLLLGGLLLPGRSWSSPHHRVVVVVVVVVDDGGAVGSVQAHVSAVEVGHSWRSLHLLLLPVLGRPDHRGRGQHGSGLASAGRGRLSDGLVPDGEGLGPRRLAAAAARHLRLAAAAGRHFLQQLRYFIHASRAESLQDQ